MNIATVIMLIIIVLNNGNGCSVAAAKVLSGIVVLYLPGLWPAAWCWFLGIAPLMKIYRGKYLVGCTGGATDPR